MALIESVQPAESVKQVTPVHKAAASEISRLALTVALIGIVAVVVLLLVRAGLARRREALRRQEREADAARKPIVSAWEEAGRRFNAEPPTPERAPAVQPVRPGGARPLALITGGARRVGRAAAIELARAGCDVLFTYRTSGQEASTLASDLAALGATASFFALDLDDLDGVEAFASERAATLERLDVLVHNASMYDPSPMTDLTPDAMIRQFRVNALAPLLLTARLAPLLRQSMLVGGGSVVAMVDIHAMGRPRRDFSIYAMSKAALGEMVRSLARDLAPQVRVNGVAPGVVAWPEQGDESDPEAQSKYVRRIPLGRAGTPEDAAGAIRWLALEAPYVTGEIVRVDGGRWLT